MKALVAAFILFSVYSSQPARADGGAAGLGNSLPELHVGPPGFPAPPYPYHARTNNEQGEVDVAITFDNDGKAAKVILLKSCGFSDLDSFTCNFIKTHWSNRKLRNQSGRTKIIFDLVPNAKLTLVPWVIPRGDGVKPGV